MGTIRTEIQTLLYGKPKKVQLTDQAIHSKEESVKVLLSRREDLDSCLKTLVDTIKESNQALVAILCELDKINRLLDKAQQ